MGISAAHALTLQNLQTRIKQLEAKAKDSENRNRRNNISIIRLPEEVEGRDPATFTEKLLKDIFPEASFSPFLMVERAHRKPTRPGPPVAPPTSFILLLLHYKDRDTILREARSLGVVKYQNTRLMFFPDFTVDIQKQRKVFTSIRQHLREKATAMLLSNDSFIELMNKITEYTWNEAQHCLSKICEPLRCSAGLIIASLMCFQQLYALQVHKTVHVDLHTIIHLISFKFKETSSMLMFSLLVLFKTLLKHKFSSALLDIVLTKTLAKEEGSIKPLTIQSTLYLVAALQNLLIQKDILLLRAAIDCFDSLIDFLNNGSPDLAIHVAAHPWNRHVLLVSLNCEENVYLQPGLIRFMALLVKYASTRILALNEIKQVIDEAANLKLNELSCSTLMDLQIFLQQLLNEKLSVEPSKRVIIHGLLQKTKNIPKEEVLRGILYVGDIAVSRLYATE